MLTINNRLLGPVLEFMPGICGDDHNVIFTKRLRLAVDDGFDLPFEDDKCFFIRMAMFLRAFARGEVNDKERDLGPYLPPWKIAASPPGGVMLLMSMVFIGSPP